MCFPLVQLFKLKGEPTGGKLVRAEFKRLLQPLIGINVGQALRHEVKITDLPDTMFAARGKMAKKPILNGDSDDEADMSHFFTILES